MRELSLLFYPLCVGGWVGDSLANEIEDVREHFLFFQSVPFPGCWEQGQLVPQQNFIRG